VDSLKELLRLAMCSFFELKGVVDPTVAPRVRGRPALRSSRGGVAFGGSICFNAKVFPEGQEYYYCCGCMLHSE